ncbi:MAG: N-acetylmuramoyl-L-alanine amidase, partial [Chloroflexota bacterium]|nr:N-acetylmuramoyl-L-alanine amidase [Chloroflexota bacterium]
PNGDFTGFLSFFLAHGHEATFAYPLEEPKMVNGRWTQRFQAAVLEVHPENAAPYKGQLELLGDEYIAAKGLGFK